MRKLALAFACFIVLVECGSASAQEDGHFSEALKVKYSHQEYRASGHLMIDLKFSRSVAPGVITVEYGMMMSWLYDGPGHKVIYGLGAQRVSASTIVVNEREQVASIQLPPNTMFQKVIFFTSSDSGVAEKVGFAIMRSKPDIEIFDPEVAAAHLGVSTDTEVGAQALVGDEIPNRLKVTTTFGVDADGDGFRESLEESSSSRKWNAISDKDDDAEVHPLAQGVRDAHNGSYDVNLDGIVEAVNCRLSRSFGQEGWQLGYIPYPGTTAHYFVPGLEADFVSAIQRGR